MPPVPLGMTTYRRRGARTAEVAMINVLLEKDPTNQIDGLVRFQRPALSSFANLGANPVRQVFRRRGVVGSLYYAVSGTSLYSITTDGVTANLGTIAGTDIPIMDGSASRLIVVSSGVAYSWDGSSLTTIVMPDIDGVPSFVSSVIYIAGYFILTVADSQHFFWLAPGDTNPDPLNFASCENSPDNIVRVARLLDEPWFFGQQTTEVFQLTGDLNAPFQPIGGRLYEKGCINKDTVSTLDNTLFWVGNDMMAYRADVTPMRISDHSMEERLRVAGPDNLRAWAFQVDGHSIYCLRCGSLGSFIFDVEFQNWPRFKSYGQETWRAHVGCQVDGQTVVAGDDATGTLWLLDSDASNDNGDPLERVVTGGVPVIGRPVKNSSFGVRVAIGWAPITGAASDPLVQLRFSDDGGNIWSSWLEMPLGLQGQYLTEVVWRQLGLMQEPGRIFQLRMTDDAIFRISYARFNEAISI